MEELKAKIQRAGEVLDDDTTTKKQMTYIYLDLMYSLADKLVEPLQKVCDHDERIRTQEKELEKLTVRVMMGIGLTALAAILGIAMAIAGG